MENPGVLAPLTWYAAAHAVTTSASPCSGGHCCCLPRLTAFSEPVDSSCREFPNQSQKAKATKRPRRSQAPKPRKCESFKCLALWLWHISSGEGLDARCIWGLQCYSNNIWRSRGPWSHHVGICAHPTHRRLDHPGDHRNKRKSNRKQFEFPLLCSNRDFKVTEESFLICTFRLFSLIVNLLATARTLIITCHSFLTRLHSWGRSYHATTAQIRQTVSNWPFLGFPSFLLTVWPVHQSLTNSALILDQSINWPSFCLSSHPYIQTPIISPPIRSSIHASAHNQLSLYSASQPVTHPPTQQHYPPIHLSFQLMLLRQTA